MGCCTIFTVIKFELNITTITSFLTTAKPKRSMSILCYLWWVHFYRPIHFIDLNSRGCDSVIDIYWTISAIHSTGQKNTIQFWVIHLFLATVQWNVSNTFSNHKGFLDDTKMIKSNVFLRCNNSQLVLFVNDLGLIKMRFLVEQ